MMKNINLKVLLCLAVTLCTIFVMFSACTETGGNQTSEPSADVYADPTEKATLVPTTLSPILPPIEITHDVELLNTFFDTPSKVDGKTNGQLLFENYESGNPYTWYLRSESEHREYVANGHIHGEYGDEFILWSNNDGSHRDYSGDVERIESSFLWDEERILNFGGTLCFDGFKYLNSIVLCNISADELIIENCDELHTVSVSGISSEKNDSYFKKIYINARLDDCFGSPCAKEFRLVVSNPEIHRDFDITAIADGDGLVNIQVEPDDELRNVYVEAAARVGSHFVGWYDEQGRLVSEKERFRLTEGDKFDYFNDVATYTARFEKD